MDKLFHHSNGDMINYLGIMVKQLVYYYHLKVLFQMNIGCMMLIYKIIMVIVSEVIYINKMFIKVIHQMINYKIAPKIRIPILSL